MFVEQLINYLNLLFFSIFSKIWGEIHIQYTILKRTIQWHSAYSQCYTTTTSYSSKSFLSPPQEDHLPSDKAFKPQNTSSIKCLKISSLQDILNLTILTFSEWAQHQKRQIPALTPARTQQLKTPFPRRSSHLHREQDDSTASLLISSTEQGWWGFQIAEGWRKAKWSPWVCVQSHWPGTQASCACYSPLQAQTPPLPSLLSSHKPPGRVCT